MLQPLGEPSRQRALSGTRAPHHVDAAEPAQIVDAQINTSYWRREMSARRDMPGGAAGLERLIGHARLAADAGEALLGGLIVALDTDRLGVGGGGLLLVAELLIGEAAARPGIEATRLDLDRIVEIACRRLRIVERESAQTARDERLRLLLDQAERGREVVDRV